MKRITFWLIAGAITTGVTVSTALRTGLACQDATPIFVTTIPAGYHEAIKARDFVFTRYTH